MQEINQEICQRKKKKQKYSMEEIGIKHEKQAKILFFA